MKANICLGLCGLVFLGSPVAFRAAAANAQDERQRLTAEVDAAAAVNYLLSHERTNGAFGPVGHAHTDLAWNYPAVHTLRLLQQPIPRPEECFINGRKGLSWPEYGAQVIAPIVGLGSLFYPELEYEMMNAYLVFDDGLAGGPGYNAVVAALGWPVWDWVRMFPYRERWQGQLPMVADADAHGDMEKWREPMERQRMLYLATRHDLAGFLEACRQGRTVCVIRGGPDKTELAYYGDPAVVEYVKQRPQEWQWWK